MTFDPILSTAVLRDSMRVCIIFRTPYSSGHIRSSDGMWEKKEQSEREIFISITCDDV